MRKKKKGFTLVEILITAVILGIIASMTIPRLGSQTARARVTEAASIMGSIRRGLLRYYDANLTFPNLGTAGEFANIIGITYKVGADGKTSHGWSFSVSAINGGADAVITGSVSSSSLNGSMSLRARDGAWNPPGYPCDLDPSDVCIPPES